MRPETAADHEGIRALVTTTMRPAEARLVEQIRASKDYLPDLALVAEEGDSLLGYVLFSRVSLQGRETWPVLALAPLCVRPGRQRGGVGSALVRDGLSRADAGGAPLVTVLGDPRYYVRFGFEPAGRYGVEPPAAFPPEAFMVKPLSGYRADLRGRVVYPPAFDVT